MKIPWIFIGLLVAHENGKEKQSISTQDNLHIVIHMYMYVY